MIDAIEPYRADQNEINRDDIVQEPRHEQNQNPASESSERHEVGNGPHHWRGCLLRLNYAHSSVVRQSPDPVATGHLAPSPGGDRRVPPRISTAASDDWHGMVAAQLMARGSTQTGPYSILGGPSRNARAMAAFRQELAGLHHRSGG
jgi:hypothetical protein